MGLANNFQGVCYTANNFTIPAFGTIAKTRVIPKIVLRTVLASQSTSVTVSITNDGNFIYKQVITGNATIELTGINLGQTNGQLVGAIVFSSDATGTDRVYVEATSSVVTNTSAVNPEYVIHSVNTTTYQFPIPIGGIEAYIIKGMLISSHSGSTMNIKVGTKKYTGVGNLYNFDLSPNSTAFISDIALIVDTEDDRVEVITTGDADVCFIYNSVYI